VIEILSPHDETFEKFPFLAELGVAQIPVIEPATLAFSLHRGAGDGVRSWSPPVGR
jgi:hypothetical protein